MGNESAKKIISRVYQDLLGLTVFRGLLAAPSMIRLMQVLEKAGESTSNNEDSGNDGKTVKALYGDFLAGLYETHTDLGRWILDMMMDDDNVCVKAAASGQKLSPILEQAKRRDLAILERLATLDSTRLKDAIQPGQKLLWQGPDWTWGQAQLTEEYDWFLRKIPVRGYGIWAKYYGFTLRDGSPVPVRYPDPIQISSLFGYEREREQIRRNIEGFVDNRAWQNMLLYGDAGTGKSSTIKAFAREYASKGLRIIEVAKNQLDRLPMLIETLSDNPLKFILFIDDLTFSRVDDDFTALKTTLEGGLLSQGDNVVIFATTNRRHLVKETHQDRAGDTLHVNDGLQETMGLAGRFGLTIIFESPKRQEYLEIVHSMAKEKGIVMPFDELDRLAEAFALRSNGRSPRVAVQFIDSILLQGLPLPPARS